MPGTRKGRKTLISSRWAALTHPAFFLQTQYFMSKQRTKSTVINLQEVADEWRQVQHAEGVQNLLWIIIKASMASPDADDWSPITRSNVLFLYERLHNLMHDLDPEHANQKLKGLWDLMECKAGQVHRSRQIFSK